MSKDIIIKNIDRVILERLKLEAKKQGTDLKSVILYLIKKSLGLEKISDKGTDFDDLDTLAGTWSNDDYSKFLSSISGFNRIDTELWK